MRLGRASVLVLAVGMVVLAGIGVATGDDGSDRDAIVSAEAPGGASSYVPVTSGAPGPSECIPHPPIRIEGDTGPQGIAVAKAPGTGTPVYRPGSGVTAGNGTAGNPYVIEGWCLTVPGEVDPGPTRLEVLDAAISIEDTTAHVVVRDNVLQRDPAAPTGSHDPAAPIPQQVEPPTFGLLATDVENLTVEGNEIRDHDGAGVWVTQARQVDLRSNHVVNNTFQGMAIRESKHFSLVDNWVRENGFTSVIFHTSGVDVVESSDGLVEGNRLDGNADLGLFHSGCDDVLIQDNTVVSSAKDGIVVSDCTDTQVQENRLRRSGQDGLEAFRGHDVRIEKNRLTGSAGSGIKVNSATHTSVLGNRIEDPGSKGLTLSGDNGTEVLDNTVRGDVSVAIRLGRSTNATLRHNTMDTGGLDVNTVQPSRLSHDIDETNLVGGRPIIYVLDEEDRVVDADAGQVFVARSENVTVTGQSIRSVYKGVTVAHSDGVTVRDSLIENTSHDGVGFFRVSDSRVVGASILQAGHDAIRVRHGDAPVLRENTALDADRYGMSVSFAPNGTVGANVIEQSGSVGVRVHASDGTEIHGNNLQGNGVGVDTLLTEPIDARENWWGCPDGPEDDACDDAEGAVLFEPWLTDPNPTAGAS